MAAAPLPKPDEAPPEPPEAEGWALLEGLRRKLDDQGTQIRRNAGHIAQLAESMASLVAMQRKRARRLDLNSFVAYLVFTVLLGGAFYYLYQSRARELVVERDTAVRRADDAVRRADDATARLVGRDGADAKALAAWQLLEAGKHDEGVRAVAALANAPLSRLDREVLAQQASHVEPSRSDAAVKTALAAFKAGRYGEAIAPVDAALVAEPGGPRAGELHYLAGIARLKTGQLAKAVADFDAAVAANATEDDLHFELASALDRTGQWARAKTEYDRFAAAHPQSPFAGYARRRGAMLGAMPQAAAAPVPVRPASPTLKPNPYASAGPSASPTPNASAPASTAAPSPPPSQPKPQPASSPAPAAPPAAPAPAP